MNEYLRHISLEEAVELMRTVTKRKDTEEIKLQEAWQRVLAIDVTARENVPPFDKSPYDGYAVRSCDTQAASESRPVCLKIIEEIPAGSYPEKKAEPGCAFKILTGAPVPEGADAVIPYEKTVFDDREVRIPVPLASGENIIRAGEDIRCGDIVVKNGTRITTPVLTQLAALGRGTVKAYQVPSAGILCTGSELAGMDEVLAPGKIRNSNGFMLEGYLRDAGICPVSLGCCQDDAGEIAAVIRQHIESCDCLITTGGASVGDYDVMKEAIELAGGQILFWKIRMKPGSAVVGGLVGGRPVFALSGNPGAAAVTLQLLVLPLLRWMAGERAWYPRRIQVRLLEDFTKKSPNRRILRGRMVVKNGEAYFALSGRQASGMTSAMRQCQLLGEIAAGTEALEAGTIIFAYDLEHFCEK